MISGFSEYISDLDASGEPPTAESFDDIWKLLRQVLRHEMRKRGLWTAPPSYLGAHGNSWEEDGLLDELEVDCYVFIFIERLQGLKNQLAVHSNIDGMVFRNVRNFLHDTQKRYDPLGFRLFTMLRSAIESLIAAGALRVLEGGPRVSNPTILGLQPWSELRPEQEDDLESVVRAWNDDLLPDLVTAWGRGWGKARARLESRIARLPAEGIEAFRFKNLIDPWKKDVRSRWNVVWGQDEGEMALEDGDDGLASIVRIVRPDTKLEDRQVFEAILRCVEERLDQRKEREKTRAYLRALWLLLRNRATEPGDFRAFSDLKVSQCLGIPRSRIPSLKATLGRLLEACQGAILGKPTVIAEDRALEGGLPQAVPSYAQKEGSRDMLQGTRERLRRQTGEAAARLTESRSEIEAQRQRPPRLGDIFVFGATREIAVEWVVVDQDQADPRRLYVVPADANPLVGSRDLALDRKAAGGLSTVRCGLGTWLGIEAFAAERRTGSVTSEIRDRIHRRQNEIETGKVRGSILEQEVDNDPEYQEWVEDLLAARKALTQSPGREERRPLLAFRRSIRWGSLNNPYGLAASAMLAVTVGLVGGTTWRQQDLKELELARQDLAAETKNLSGALEQSRQNRLSLEARAQRQERWIEDLGQRDHRRCVEISTLGHDLAEARRGEPELDLPFVFLNRQESVRGPEDPLLITAGAKRLALILEVVDFEPYLAYRLQISRADTSREIWSNDRLTKRGSELSLDLPLSTFRSGDYVLHIYGLGKEEEKLLETYLLSLRLG